MTQAMDDRMTKAQEYLRHQGSKSPDELGALMDRTAGDWERCLQPMSDGQATFKPSTPTGPEGEDEWCTKEVLGHVLASQRGLNVTIAQMAGVEPPAQAEQIRAMGVKSEADEALPLSELRPKIAAVCCEESKRLVTSLPEGEKLEKQFPHPIFGQFKADPKYPSA
ncbi:MAG: DinB family protein [Chloroflexi bacterium]|nr:MAG: DinB family protein [Chloroflexota bacterium]